MKNSTAVRNNVYHADKSVIRFSWHLCLLSIAAGLAAFVVVPLLTNAPDKPQVLIVQPAPVTLPPKPKIIEPEKIHKAKVKPKAEVKPQPKAPAPPKLVPALKLSALKSPSLSAPTLPDVDFNPDFNIQDMPAITPTQANQIDATPGGLGEGIEAQVIKDIYMEGELDQLPSRLNQLKVKYPSILKRRRLVGEVTVKMIIDKNGRVSQVDIIKAEPRKYFERETLKAVKRLYFSPGTVKGKPVRFEVIQKIIINPPNY